MRPTTNLFAVKIQTHCGSSLPARFTEKVVGAIPGFVRPKQSCFLWSSDAFWKFSASKIYWKSSGRNSTIFSSKNEAVCREIHTHFESSLPASFTKKLWAQFHDFCVKKRSCWLWNSGAFWSSRFARFMNNVQGALSRFVHPKIKLFPVMFRRISEVLRPQGLQRKLWTNFHNWCVHKRSCLLWSSDAFGKFPLVRLIKKFWAHFHDLCVA